MAPHSIIPFFHSAPKLDEIELRIANVDWIFFSRYEKLKFNRCTTLFHLLIDFFLFEEKNYETKDYVDGKKCFQ